MIVQLEREDDFDGWRDGARTALLDGLSPAGVTFRVGDDAVGLFDNLEPASAGFARASTQIKVPKAFMDLARQVICHSDPERFVLLYILLVRLQNERSLLMKGADKDVHRANALAKEVRRDAHKMKAFVRFRSVETNPVERFAAWFEPSHHIVRFTAPFFKRRFTGMPWSILTPKGCAHWDGDKLTYSPAVSARDAPKDDALEDFWRSYYASIFNPARLKTAAMQSEMPKKYWHNLPEAQLIPDLIRDARSREQGMKAAEPSLPNPAMMAHREIAPVETRLERASIDNLESLRIGLSQCRDCPLWQPATQVVPGTGSPTAKLMLVGEQPGDREDLEGMPFVGPAGSLLNEAFEEAGIERNNVYLTNAVKHFKFEPRGKRRLHKNPNVGEIKACNWWLKKEIELIQPRIIVALGASAVRGVTGKPGTISGLRGQVHTLQDKTQFLVTRHPASILRQRSDEDRQIAYRELLADLVLARQVLDATGSGPGKEINFPDGGAG